jgi:sigma-B regulation protein RsbU (phosphoserine phosphatase)
LIKTQGCDENLAADVYGRCQSAKGVLLAPGADPGAGDAVAVLTADPIAPAIAADGVCGIVEIGPDDHPEQIARALEDGIAAGTWFVSLHNPSALDFEVASGIIKGAGTHLGFAAGADGSRLEDMETALRELLMNAAVHGNLELSSPGASSYEVRQHHDAVAARMGAVPYQGRRVRVEASSHEGTVTFAVVDEGIGYEPKPEPTKEAYSGRGMTIVNQLSDDVKLGDGGRRTSVTFSAGKNAQSATPTVRTDVLSEVDSAVYGCNILIVDDEEILVEMTRFQLEDAGFSNLDAAFDGEEAWSKIGHGACDLVILDHTMPGMTGLEILERMRAEPRFRDIPVVLVSAHEDREFRANAYRFGATNVLTKPVDPDLLIHRVRQLLTNLLLLRKLRAYYRRVEQELAQAQRMQEALIPSDEAMAAVAGPNGVRLSGRFQTSSELGGDWWGLSDFGDGQFAIYTVDFSGHGVGPAINTFRLHTLMRDFPPPLDGPGRYLTRLNSGLCDILPRGQYATMLFGVVDVAQRRFTYAASGSPPPIYGALDGSVLSTAESAGVPLGLSRRSSYEDRVIEFTEDGFLFLFSDVLLEGEDEGGEMLGEEGLMKMVGDAVREPTENDPFATIIDRFLTRTKTPLDDDMTAVWLGFSS